MEGYAITRGRLSRYRLFWTKNIYDRQGAEQMFFSAVRENCAYHYRHCREYRKILKRSGFRPGHLESSRDIGRIPVLPTLFLNIMPYIPLPRSVPGLKPHPPELQELPAR